MSNSTTSITKLLSVTSELEAAAIVAALADQGIEARHVGGYTAGFRAEAPAMVQVLVHENDLARAAEIVEHPSSHAAAIDWSTVDCGDRAPLCDDEHDFAENQKVEPRPLQVSLRAVLIFQTVFCVLLAFSQSTLATLLFVAGIVTIVYSLVAIGTIQIISKREQANELLRYVATSFVVLGILFYAIHLFRVLLGSG